MASGKVKWFDNKRGFGFIAQSSGKDVFVHHSAIQGRGYKTLAEGEWVTFNLVESGKGPKAEKVERLRPNAGGASASSAADWHSIKAPITKPAAKSLRKGAHGRPAPLRSTARRSPPTV